MAIRHMSHIVPKCRRSARGSILILELGGAIVRSAVPTVRSADGDSVVLGVTLEGETAQLIVAGALQLSNTCWPNPLAVLTLIA
jgi:hypothetical protein